MIEISIGAAVLGGIAIFQAGYWLGRWVGTQLGPRSFGPPWWRR